MQDTHATNRPAAQARPVIRAVTLDAGHTLLFPNPSLGAVYEQVARRHELPMTAAAAEERFTLHWRREQARCNGLIYGCSRDDALRFWYRVNHGIFSPAGVDGQRLRGFVDDLFETFAHGDVWRLNPDWTALRDTCRRCGIPIVLLSNWDVRLRGLLDELGVLPDMEAVLISCELGAEKPAPETFVAAVRACGTDHRAVLHVGDTWRDDILGATNVGLTAAWYNPEATPCPSALTNVLDIRRLTDIVPLLNQP